MPNSDQIVAIAMCVIAFLALNERDEARAEATHYQRLSEDRAHAALLLGEPWSIAHGVATITRDLADGTANGWVGWLYNEDPLAPCVDGPGYIVCVSIKETCRGQP